jgi:hypothetical protein
MADGRNYYNMFELALELICISVNYVPYNIPLTAKAVMVLKRQKVQK